ncbi:peroxygenase-like [Impatiens glandulifera]|uniref:peroxygenase-like n=1 Tax=Impatiens glandulifera TaxID=253017 RepID=UPI001FB09BC6|nr:peroxygenase-like [Impatiens glandulifera]
MEDAIAMHSSLDIRLTHIHDEDSRQECLIIGGSTCPVTVERNVRSDLDTTLPKPYLDRGSTAPDMDHPQGTIGHPQYGMSVLQQHASFFDQDDNEIVIFRCQGLRCLTMTVGSITRNVFLAFGISHICCQNVEARLVFSSSIQFSVNYMLDT